MTTLQRLLSKDIFGCCWLCLWVIISPDTTNRLVTAPFHSWWRLSVRLLCRGCVLHSPSNCQTDFLLPERNWTTLVNSIAEKNVIIKVEIKSTISSQLTSKLQKQLVVSTEWLSALSGPLSQCGPGLRWPQVGPSGAVLGGWCGSHVVTLVKGHWGCRRWLVLR